MSKNKTQNENDYTGDLPLGFGMALTHNIPAMKVFAALPEEKRKVYIQEAQGLSTREEMANLVSTILEKNN